MHNANVIELKSTNAELVIEIGFVPSYAIVKNVTSGSQLEYVNTRIGMTQMAIDNGDVVNDIGEDTDYIAANGTLATDGALTRTAKGSIGQVSSTSAGLVLAAGIADINDAVDEQLIVIAFRSEL
jgi:hypothetical protein